MARSTWLGPKLPDEQAEPWLMASPCRRWRSTSPSTPGKPMLSNPGKRRVAWHERPRRHPRSSWGKHWTRATHRSAGTTRDTEATPAKSLRHRLRKHPRLVRHLKVWHSGSEAIHACFRYLGAGDIQEIQSPKPLEV